VVNPTQSERQVTVKAGELVVDSQRTANAMRSHHDLHRALQGLARIGDLVAELDTIADEATVALNREPEFDHLPTFVQVDPSWADTLPPCVECGRDVPWPEALLMPCSNVPDGEVTTVGIVHRFGCRDA